MELRWFRALVIIFLIGSVSCGAMTDLEVDERRRPDADLSADGDGDADGDTDGDGDADTDPPECSSLRWSACEALDAPVLVSEGDLGQSPDVAFTGEELVVVYDTFAGNTMALVSLEGEVLRRAELGGIQAPRVAWSGDRGVMIADSGFQRLDRQGPLGEFEWLPNTGWQLEGDLFFSGGLFIVLSGALAYSTPPPLYQAWIDDDGFDFDVIAEGGPRSPPEHCVDEAGAPSWVVSTVWYRDQGELYQISGQDLEPVMDLSGRLPQEGNGFVVGLAEHRGRLLMLYATAPSGSISGWAQFLVELAPGAGSWRVDASSNGSSGHLLVVGDSLLVASPAIHPSHQVSLATFDPEAPSGDVLGELLVLGGEGHISHSPRMAATARGFALVWSEQMGDVDGMSTRLQVFDCCVP